MVKTVYKQAAGQESRQVLFLSATAVVLYAIKLLNRGAAQTWIVMHGALDDLRKARIRLRKPFYYGNALLLGNRPDIRYLVLGNYIGDRMPGYAPELTPFISALDHPGVFMPEQEPDNNGGKLPVKPVFGSIGVVAEWKGSGAFLRLAESLHRQLGPDQAAFLFIGAMLDERLADGISASCAVEITHEVGKGAFISHDHLDQAVQSINYAVFLYPKDAYVLKASGAVMDTFRCAKPIIATRCAMFDYYFSTFGDIGYLCEDEQEIHEVMKRLILAPEPGRYRRQQETMIRQRVRFGVEATAEKLKHLWNIQ